MYKFLKSIIFLNNRVSPAKISALVVTLLSAILLVTLFVDFPTHSPHIKGLSAVSFLLSGAVCLTTGVRGWPYLVAFVSVYLTFSHLLALFTHSAAPFFLFETGVDASLFTPYPNIPSIATMVCFLVVAISAFGSLVNGGKLARLGGLVIFGAGVTATLGHIIRLPAMYFYHPEVSASVPVDTAVMFVLLGFSLSRLPQLKKAAP